MAESGATEEIGLLTIKYTPPPGWDYHNEVQTSDFWGAFWTKILIGCLFMSAAFMLTIFLLVLSKGRTLPRFLERCFPRVPPAGSPLDSKKRQPALPTAAAASPIPATDASFL
jgi:hypothetical protein